MPVVGEELALQREDGNDRDKHAVTVMKDSDIVGHVPLSMILPRVMVLPHTWWPHQLPCYSHNGLQLERNTV